MVATGKVGVGLVEAAGAEVDMIPLIKGMGVTTIDNLSLNYLRDSTWRGL